MAFRCRGFTRGDIVQILGIIWVFVRFGKTRLALLAFFVVQRDQGLFNLKLRRLDETVALHSDCHAVGSIRFRLDAHDLSGGSQIRGIFLFGGGIGKTRH